MKYYYKDEGVATTCSSCGSPATYGDSGIKCSNENCKNS